MVTEGRLRLATEQAKLSPCAQMGENWLKQLLVTSGGLRVYNSAFAFLRFACPRAKEAMFNVGLDSAFFLLRPLCVFVADGHISPNTPDLFRPPKLSGEETGRGDWLGSA